MLVAIQPDSYGPRDASAPLWRRYLEEFGHKVIEVDVYRADILKQLEGCHGFMWRHGHVPAMRQIAKRLLPVLEKELGLAVYPDQNSSWHYDDKIAQAYLLSSRRIPTPETWVWYDANAAKTWLDDARYPLVLKLASGAGSENVCLIRDKAEASQWIDRLFGPGVASLSTTPPSLLQRLLSAMRSLSDAPLFHPWELHKGYALFQEFIPGNTHDTRITVIGNRAFGFRRFNRDHDFRASGSGKIDFDPAGIAPEMLRLAFRIAELLKLQSAAFDMLWRGSQPIIVEISYTYASWAVHDCPGHWDKELKWHAGHQWPEYAQAQDFNALLEKHVRPQRST